MLRLPHFWLAVPSNHLLLSGVKKRDFGNVKPSLLRMLQKYVEKHQQQDFAARKTHASWPTENY